jgi:transcriptional regulator with XRE-family HTH domain
MRPVKRTTRATPKQRQRRQGGSVKSETGFVDEDEVLATNVRAYRLVRKLTQAELADRMSLLGHGWHAGTVGFAERNERTISAGELFGLAIALEAGVLDLLDPTGIDGRQTKPVDYARGQLPHNVESTLPAILVKHWLRGAVELHFRRGPGSFTVSEVEGHEEELAESERAWDKLSEERAQRKRERLANEEPS